MANPNGWNAVSFFYELLVKSSCSQDDLISNIVTLKDFSAESLKKGFDFQADCKAKSEHV
jgi:hypothetical protein